MSFHLLYPESWGTGLRLLVDLALVLFLVCSVYKLVEGSTAVKSILGFLILHMSYWIVQTLHLKLLASIFSIFTVPIVPIILFQREIRHLLFSVGAILVRSKTMIVQLIPWLERKKSKVDVTEMVQAVQALRESNTGALIAFTKYAELRYYEESGDVINALVSARLLIAIFNKYSPLHDGAMIIHRNKIVAVRCVLPLTESPNVGARYGLRHRAAVGLTEVTDALVLVVSEESGEIGVARKGSMENNLSVQEVRNALNNYLNDK